MERKYKVYRVTGPDGRQYIGWTGMKVQERWRNHVKRARAGKAAEHPFYNAIRQYGEGAFTIETLKEVDSRITAQLIEARTIASSPRESLYNLSSGGVNDSSEGGRIFWERMNADSQKKAAYLKKLSDTKKARDWTDYENLAAKNKEWRQTNAKEAYRLSRRAIRIANKANGVVNTWQDKVDPRPLKERLMHKYRLNEVKSGYVTEIWANRSDEERAEIFGKISSSHIAYMATKTPEERREITAKARASIDKDKQGRAASHGLKNWWVELRKDPERYEAYIQSRIDSRRRNKVENV